MSFLSGNSEMARRIRDFDWKSHPFGPPDQWSQSLRSALGICLHSAFPTAIYWGSELRLLYNDAWSTVPGPRHPGCLGQPAQTVWSDIWHVIEPQFFQVIETGEGLFVDDQMLPMRRYGVEEETYWSYSFTPIRGEDGTIEGIYNSGQETTDKVLRQRQTAFLLSASDRIRELAATDRIMRAVCRMLGEHLGAIRVGIRELASSEEQFPVSVEWTADGIAPTGAAAPWQNLGTLREGLLAGRAVRIDRVSDLEDSTTRDILTGLGAGSAFAVPSFKSAGLNAVLFLHRAEARAWTDEEIATAEQVFALVTRAVERERTLAREKAMMQEIDHRARNLLGISQALVRLTRARDVDTYKESLLDRLSALGKTLGILSAARWSGTSLRNLLESELVPFLSSEDSRVTLRGPKIVLSNDLIQPFAMAIHELTTNAVKYGALSAPGGTLDVAWEIGTDGDLTVAWRETSDRAAEAATPADPGFGTQLLSLAVESQLNGTITRTVADGTFRCDLKFPFSGEA